MNLRYTISKLVLATLAVSAGLQALAQGKIGLPAQVPPAPQVFQTEPWENPEVRAINRDKARVTAYSFASVEEALEGDRESSGRFKSLNGDWDFYFSSSPEEAPEDFFAARVEGWDKIEVP